MRARDVTLLVPTMLLLVAGCDTAVSPPVAKIEPTTLEKHGDVRVDNYYWLNQREDPEVIDYLEAENAYTESRMAHTEALQQTLFDEFKERIKQTDESVPYLRDGYYYYSRVEEGKDYPSYARKKGSLDADEELTYELVLPEVADLAKGLISVSSPVGRGLLGKKCDDKVEIVIPSGKKRFEVLELLTLPERS